MNQRIKIVVLPIFCLITAILCNLSCQKELSIDLNRKLSIKEKFFEHSYKTDKLILRVIDEIRNRNNKKEFVADFAIKNGFAVWEKPIISYPHSKSATLNGFTHSNIEEPVSDTFAYIPIVQENADKVNGFILAKISGGVELLYSLAKDYKAFSFEGLGGLNDATKFVLTNLLLNKEVFGISDYKITDYRLFTSDPEHDKVKDVSIEGRLMAGECAIISWSSQYCGTPNYSGCQNGCDNCGTYCYPNGSSVEICTAPNTVNWPPGGIGFNTGGGGSGSSGGGGGEIPHYYPCTPGPGTVPPGSPPPCPEPGPGSGWTPHPNVSSQMTLCEIAMNAAKKMDSLYINSKVDSMLTLLPSGWQTDSIEYGFPLYKKFQGLPHQPGQIIVTGYFPGIVQSGSVGNIEINFNFSYNSRPTGTVHVHTPNGYAAQSASDIYQLITTKSDTSLSHPDVNLKYEGNFVVAEDGSQYAITVTNDSLASTFLNTKDPYLDGDKWKEGSPIGKAFKDAKTHFLKKFKNEINKENLAYEMAMAAVLTQFRSGVTLHKKNSNGNFKPLMVNTVILDPSKPKEKKYEIQNCL